MMRNVRRTAALVLALTLAGCATNDPNRRAETGAAIGAIAGAIIGHQVNRDSGRFVGAAVGALTGAAVGHYMDRQQQEFDQQLAAEQRKHDIEVQRLKDDSLKISVNGEVSFDFNSAALKPAFLTTLDKMADILKRYNRSVVHVIGYTDNVGSAAYNQRLSERRAQSVATYLADRGVAANRLVTEGRGEADPRASNATAAGRQLNRRVELIIKPVVEGQENNAYAPPPGSAPPAGSAPSTWQEPR